MRKGFFLVGLLSLGGCLEDSTPKPTATTESAPLAQVRTAAEEHVRGVAQDRGNLRFRAMETHRQAVAGTYAVCGQATVMGGGVFVPFVSVVKTGGGAPEVEQFVGRTNIEATRVYVELVSRCFDGGGPVMRAGGTLMSQPTPPLPNGLPLLDQATAPEPKDPGLVTAAAAPAAGAMGSGTVTMRQNGNLRSSPGGGGAVIRVARSGTTLHVFATAPGGWYQVGDGAPEGWVHSSVATAQANSLALVQ